MVASSINSSREDGTPNRVVMKGKEGYLGDSLVYIQYLEDGWIKMSGENLERRYNQILISEFVLEPGKYTLTGLREQKNTIDLQLGLKEEAGFHSYFYQYNEDVSFSIEQMAEAALYVRVYPEIEEIDVKARPAVYRDD